MGVRHAVRIEGLSRREAGVRFGIDPRTVSKMMAFSVPPGYRRSRPPARPKLDPPAEQLLRRQSVTPGDLRNHHPRRQRLLDDPRLVVQRRAPPAADPVVDLHPPHGPRRLKRRVKSRHKLDTSRSHPSNPGIQEPADSHLSARPERWGQNSSYDGETWGPVIKDVGALLGRGPFRRAPF